MAKARLVTMVAGQACNPPPPPRLTSESGAYAFLSRRRERKYRHQQGFTLIELAVVLVIIGLLTGGILAGQELIRKAAVQAQISQVEKFNTAANTFREKYGGLPGDLQLSLANQFGFYTNYSCTGSVAQRDGNGLIDGFFPSVDHALIGENSMFWSDLTTAHLIEGSFTPGNCDAEPSVTATTISQYLPPGKIGYQTSVHVYDYNAQNWFMLADITTFSPSSTVYATPTIPVAIAYAIDQKIDDGIPTTGRVQAIYLNATPWGPSNAPNSMSDSATTCYNTASSTAAYSITYKNGNGANCALSFRMQAGD